MANIFGDLHNNVKLLRSITPAAVGTTGIANGKLGPVIDTKGYGGVEFINAFGTSAAVTDVVNCIVYECSTSDGTFTSVADTNLLGTEAAASYPAANPRVSGTSQNMTVKVGYRGSQRYVKSRLYGIGTATCVVSQTVLLHTPRDMPVS